MRDYAHILPDVLDHDLSMAGWNGRFDPYPGIIPTQFAMQHLRRSFLKKFRDGADSSADEAALALFLKINAECGVYKLDTLSCFTHEAVVVGEARDFLYDFFHDTRQPGHPSRMSWPRVFQHLGVGNGANIGAPGTDFLSKVGLSSMSTSDYGLVGLYDEAIRPDGIWSRVESTRRKVHGVEVVKGSRLAFVPKTRLISRTVCTEPLLNMFFQMGIGLTIRDELRKQVGIDLSTQPDKNRRLAQLGSETGRFGTIDLSSASDSMSLSLVRSMFPSSVVSMLERARTPLTTLPGGSEVELHMVSSMGNAFTFPLQTLLFCSIVLASYKVLGIKPEYPHGGTLGNFAVFGDDIIVDHRVYDLVTRVLSICGFSVNQDKSFNTGDFRESCGCDYLYGHNVRGIYIKTLKREHDTFSAINRLNRWSAKWCLPLPTVLRVLTKSVRKLYVPMYVEDTAGIKVPLSMRKPLLVTPPKRVRAECVSNALYAYRILKLYGKKVDVSNDEDPAMHELRGWLKCPNPDAILLAALAGKLRDAVVSIRAVDRIRTRLSWGTSSSWDYVPPEHRDFLCAFGDGWKSVIELNLSFYEV